MPRVIIFDFDGMLVNVPYFSLQYEKKFGVPAANWGNFFSEEFYDCKIGKADLKKVIKPYLTKIKWKKGVDDLLKYWFKGEDSFDKRMLRTIKRLQRQGVCCVLATDNEKYKLAYFKKERGLDKIFNKIYASCETGYLKKQIKAHEYIYKDLLKKYPDLNKKQVMFWGGDKDKVLVAKKYGFDGRIYKNYDDFLKRIKL